MTIGKATECMLQGKVDLLVIQSHYPAHHFLRPLIAAHKIPKNYPTGIGYKIYIFSDDRNSHNFYSILKFFKCKKKDD
jgi:hypothetical protein